MDYSIILKVSLCQIRKESMRKGSLQHILFTSTCHICNKGLENVHILNKIYDRDSSTAVQLLTSNKAFVPFHKNSLSEMRSKYSHGRTNTSTIESIQFDIHITILSFFIWSHTSQEGQSIKLEVDLD